ncbi:MAG: hypothetical protein ACI9N1_000366 [Flavobacteriales bacterium]|jgi:hypothetical protein
MSTTKKTATKKKVTRRKSTNARPVGRPKKAAPVSLNKTLVTIHPDGIITVEKTEETVTEQMMTKGAAN